MPAKALLIVCAASLSACATVRVVNSKPGKGGVIAEHPGIFGDAKQKAMAAAKSNCGGKKVDIVEEGEAKIGTTSTADTKGGKHSGDSSQLSDTTDKTEWRMTYKCVKK